MIAINISIFEVKNVRDVAEELGIETSRFLMSRQRLGVPLREALVEKLENMEKGVLVIDFKGVEEVSISVAEELGPILFSKFLELHAVHKELFLVYSNVTNDLLPGWQRIFRGPEKHMVACVFEHYDGERFFGFHFVGDGLPDALRSILHIIYLHGETNSTELENRGVAAASRKLNSLTRKFSWLLQRKQISLDEKAWTYVYMPPVPIQEEF